MISKTVNPKIEASWKRVLEKEFSAQYIKELKDFLIQEYQEGRIIYPPGNQIFQAFNLTPFHTIKVVILGQDPYHGKGQAHGLSFSVPNTITPPPSLKNIFKELHDDLGLPIPASGNLESWARQGVLLLNAILTVRANSAASHHKKGWERFTDAIITTLSDQTSGIVFLLWGNYAKEKEKLIDGEKHLILTAAHPSPFSAHSGFFGCKHFSKTNTYLKSQGKTPIHWSL